MSRIPVKLQKPHKPSSKEAPSVFDISLGFAQVAQIAGELAKLKKKYEVEIAALSSTTAVTQKEVRKELARINSEFVTEATELLEASSSAVLDQFKTELRGVIGQFESRIKEADTQIARAKTIQKGDKGDKGDPGADGAAPKLEEIVLAVLNHIRQPQDGKDAVINDEVLEKIIKKLTEKYPDIKNVEGLRAEVRNASSKTMLGGGQGSWKQKQLSGTIDGNNTVFTFSGDEPAQFSERIFLNYIEQNPFTDYAINYKTNTVTYTTAPDASLSGLPHIIRYM